MLNPKNSTERRGEFAHQLCTSCVFHHRRGASVIENRIRCIHMGSTGIHEPNTSVTRIFVHNDLVRIKACQKKNLHWYIGYPNNDTCIGTNDKSLPLRLLVNNACHGSLPAIITMICIV